MRPPGYEPGELRYYRFAGAKVRFFFDLNK